MKLWVARHGWAGPNSKDPKIERERPLLPEGKATAQAIAKTMVELDEVPDVIFTSTFARAVMTADIYGRAFGVVVNPLGDLTPDRPLESVIEDLISHDELKRVMIVGHVDNTTPAFRAFESDDKWTDLLRGEVRRVKIDRKDLHWSLKWALKPSDIGRPDHKDT